MSDIDCPLCGSIVRGDRASAIPEGAVLVTEETLAAAIHAVDERWGDPTDAAAILRYLREGTE